MPDGATSFEIIDQEIGRGLRAEGNFSPEEQTMASASVETRVRDFLKKFFSAKEVVSFRRGIHSSDVDVMGSADVAEKSIPEQVSSGDYKISHLEINRSAQDGKVTFHFWVGNREMTLTGRAAEYVEYNYQKLEEAIKEFLTFFFTGDNKEQFDSWDVDISAPRRGDMESIMGEKYSISNLRVDDPELNRNIPNQAIHFYIGQTEVHLTGKAAQQVFEQWKSNE